MFPPFLGAVFIEIARGDTGRYALARNHGFLVQSLYAKELNNYTE